MRANFRSLLRRQWKKACWISAWLMVDLTWKSWRRNLIQRVMIWVNIWAWWPIKIAMLFAGKTAHQLKHLSLRTCVSLWGLAITNLTQRLRRLSFIITWAIWSTFLVAQRELMLAVLSRSSVTASCLMSMMIWSQLLRLFATQCGLLKVRAELALVLQSYAQLAVQLKPPILNRLAQFHLWRWLIRRFLRFLVRGKRLVRLQFIWKTGIWILINLSIFVKTLATHI